MGKKIDLSALKAPVSIILFAILSYVFMYLILLGYGVISTRIAELVQSANQTTDQQVIINLPTYHPDVVIYESQKSPENFFKVIYIVIGFFIAFVLIYAIIKVGIIAVRVIIGFSIYLSSLYALRGLLNNYNIIYPITLGFIVVFILFSKRVPNFVRAVPLALVVGGIGAFLGIMLKPFLWAIALAALLLYDIISVYKGPMKELSEIVAEHEIPLLLKIKDQEREHVIGLGDYAIPMSFLASIIKYESSSLSLISFLGFMVGILLALFIAKRRGPQPGLLYIVPGSIVPYATYLLIQHFL